MEAPTNWVEEQMKRRTSLKYQARLIEAIEDFKRRYPEYTVLDVGFGSKENLALWSKHTATGLDVNSSVIEETGGRVILGDGHKMTFGNNFFQAIFSSHTFEHSYDPHKLAREFERVAQKVIYLIVPLAEEEQDPAHFAHIRTIWDVINCFTFTLVMCERRKTGDYRFIFERHPDGK